MGARRGRPTCRIYVGLPASGKTFDALQWVAGRPNLRAHLSRDDLRRTLHGRRHGTPWQEDMVTAAQDSALTALLIRGVSVAVDDTNLRPEHLVRLAGVAAAARANVVVCNLTGVEPNRTTMGSLLHIASRHGVAVNVMMLPPVSVDRCVERDRVRPGDQQVGEETIRGMFGRYLARVATTE